MLVKYRGRAYTRKRLYRWTSTGFKLVCRAGSGGLLQNFRRLAGVCNPEK